MRQAGTAAREAHRTRRPRLAVQATRRAVHRTSVAAPGTAPGPDLRRTPKLRIIDGNRAQRLWLCQLPGHWQWRCARRGSTRRRAWSSRGARDAANGACGPRGEAVALRDHWPVRPGRGSGCGGRAGDGLRRPRPGGSSRVRRRACGSPWHGGAADRTGPAQPLAVLQEEAPARPSEMLLAPLLDADRDRTLLRGLAVLPDIGTARPPLPLCSECTATPHSPPRPPPRPRPRPGRPWAGVSRCTSLAASCLTSTSPGLPAPPPSRQLADHCDCAAIACPGPSRRLKRRDARRRAPPLAGPQRRPGRQGDGPYGRPAQESRQLSRAVGPTPRRSDPSRRRRPRQAPLSRVDSSVDPPRGYVDATDNSLIDALTVATTRHESDTLVKPIEGSPEAVPSTARQSRPHRVRSSKWRRQHDRWPS